MTILLVDGDELLHTTLAGLETETNWGNDVWVLSVNEEAASEVITARIEKLVSTLNPDRILFCFSGPGENWRRSVLPGYKGNRLNVRKPMLFAHLKQRMLEEQLIVGPGYEFVSRNGLEADDAIGILATKPSNQGNTIVVSQDKDFLGVPGRLWRNWRENETPVIQGIQTPEARRFHLYQTLTGDAVDGYTGCPGIGDATANKLLDGSLKYSPTLTHAKRGANKGEEVVRWDLVHSNSPWETVVSCYEKAGLKEKDALVQARVARIAQWEDWDRDNQRVRLWNPPR